jgi:hypothetical protein
LKGADWYGGYGYRTAKMPVETERRTLCMTKPNGGEAVRLAAPWKWGMLPPGSIGIIDGVTDEECEESASIVFNFSAFRGKSSKYSQGPEYCSCSGGPATIATPVDELKPTNETHTYTAWRWKDLPRANGGESFQVTVPLWEWTPSEL